MSIPTSTKLRGNLIDASLTYYPTPLTTLKLDVKTTVDETIIGGVSGGFTHDYSLQVEHAFRRWLLGTVKVGYTNTIYEGSSRIDDRYIASAAMLYKLSRDIVAEGRISPRMAGFDRRVRELRLQHLHGRIAAAAVRDERPQPSSAFSSSRNSGAISLRFSA